MFVAPQIGRDAAVAAVLGLRKVTQQVVPHKGRLWEAVQKHQHGSTHLAADPAAQGDAVRKDVCEGLYHVCIQS